jgi:nucleotide-binding universal stress UspA family protein
MMNTLLIPIDDSTLVKNMIKKLPQILDISGKDILLTHISDPFPPTIYTESALSEFYISEKSHRESCEEFAKKLFEVYKKFLPQASSVSSIHIFDSDITQGILKAAKKHKADGIVMASHRYTGINNVLLGDKVHKVIVSSKYPVLVV